MYGSHPSKAIQKDLLIPPSQRRWLFRGRRGTPSARRSSGSTHPGGGASGSKYFLPSTWYPVLGTGVLRTRYLVPSIYHCQSGIKYLVQGYLVRSTWYSVRSMIPSIWRLIPSLITWPRVPSMWVLVTKSLVSSSRKPQT